MGEIVNIHCRSCNKNWECQIGSGLMHGSLEAVTELFSEAQTAEIERAASQEPFSPFSFSFRPARCNCCGRIVSVPVLTLTESGHMFLGVCPVCGQKVRPIARLSKTACPSCGKIGLETETIGHWD